MYYDYDDPVNVWSEVSLSEDAKWRCQVKMPSEDSSQKRWSHFEGLKRSEESWEISWSDLKRIVN